MGIDRIALLGPAPPDRGGIARETALLAEELSTRVEVSYFTFSRPYPRWLDPRRFDSTPGADRSAVPVRSVLDYRSPRSWVASGPTACAPTAWPRGSTSGRWRDAFHRLTCT